MSDNFLKRFKGKVETMDKEGASKLTRQPQNPVKVTYNPANNQNSHYQANSNANNIQRNYLDFNNSYGNVVNNQTKQTFNRKQTFYTQPKPNYQYTAKQQMAMYSPDGSKRKARKENKAEVS